MYMKRALLIALNTPGYYSPAIHYLKLYAGKDASLMRQCRIYLAEYDLCVQDQSILNNISKLRPDLLAFSCYLWNIEKALTLAKAVKLAFPEIKILFGGQEVTNSTLSYLECYPFLDILVDGEGEEVFYRLLQTMVGDDFRSLANIPGIQYRDGETKVINPPNTVPIDLDQIPSPYLEDAIHIPSKTPLGVLIEHVRGCAGNCAFCFEALRTRKPRAFSLERIQAEVKWALSRGHDCLHLMDPVLAMNDPCRLESLYTLFEEARHGRSCRVSVEVCADNINQKNYRLFDCYQFFDIGLQTIHPTVNRIIHRNFDLDTFVTGFRLLKSLGKIISLYLIYGLPGENFQEFMKGVCFADSLGASMVFLNRLCVLDGTPLRRHAAQYQLEYCRRPPYQVLSNTTYSFQDIVKSESFARNYMRFHSVGKSPSLS